MDIPMELLSQYAGPDNPFAVPLHTLARFWKDILLPR